MHRAARALLFFAFLLFQACTPVALSPLPPQSIPLSTGQSVFIDLQTGEVDITTGEAGSVHIGGSGPAGDFASAVTTNAASDGLHISLKSTRPAARLELRLPPGAHAVVENYAANITIHDFTGDMKINAVTGHIEIVNARGTFNIVSNRGDVSATRSSGEVHVAGNYGVLSFNDVHGQQSASTIMGTLRLSGALQAGDNASLESDHGPVEVLLSPGSDVRVKITTTTGVVTCTVPGLSYNGQGCTGSLSHGAGSLTVRTVSGAASLNPLTAK